MKYVRFVSAPRGIKIREYVDIFLSHGWQLVKTELAPADQKSTAYLLGWPEEKGIPVIPKGFEKVKVFRNTDMSPNQ